MTDCSTDSTDKYCHEWTAIKERCHCERGTAESAEVLSKAKGSQSLLSIVNRQSKIVNFVTIHSNSG